MTNRTVALVAITMALFSAPASAQQGLPAQDQHATGPSIPRMGYMPSASGEQTQTGAENPAIRSLAQNTYAQLASGKLNRAKLTQDVNNAFTDSTEMTLAQQLSALGSPVWSFVQNTQTMAGAVSIYRLQYPNGLEYLTLGAGDDGVIYALGLTHDAPPT